MRGNGLARVAESLTVVDAARVKAEGGTREDFVRVVGTAGVGVAEAHFEGVVEVWGLDVSARSATVLVVDWVNVDEHVVYAGNVADGLGETGEGEVGVGDAVVGLAGVVLDFLQEHDRGRVQEVDDVRGDEWYTGVVGSEVLDVVLAECEAVAASVGGNRRRWRESVVRALHACACLGKQSKESESVGHDTGDVFQFITEPGLIGVAAAVEWCTNDDRLRV